MSAISQLSEKKISPENFRALHKELHKITTSNVNLQTVENDVKTLIESITEYLIDGDKPDMDEDIMLVVNMLQDMPEELRKAAIEQVKVLSKMKL